MATINDLAAKLIDLDMQIDNAEKTLKLAKEKRRELVEQDLPTAMRAAQVTAFETMVGNRFYELKVRNKIVGALSRAEDQDAALQYLEEKGFTGATNATISVTVSDGERDEFIEALADMGQAPKVERKINHMTLASFARECLSNGEGFDLDKVGLTALTHTIIKEKN